MWLEIIGTCSSFIIGAIYHPPKPIYDTNNFLSYIESCVLYFTINFPQSVIVIAGDVNSLPEEILLANTGLLSIVTTPTRGDRVLDKIYISEPIYKNIKICNSTVKSDHRAIIAHNTGIITTHSKTSTVVQFRKKSPSQHANFLANTPLSVFDGTILIDSVEDIANNFYEIASHILNKFYPLKTTTITSGDPSFITPEIKTLLRKKNYLMRANKYEEASAVADKIGKAIAKFNSSYLQHLGKDTSTAELWEAVRKVTKKCKNFPSEHNAKITAVELNNHYSSISTDHSYCSPYIKQSAPMNQTLISEYQVFNILDSLHHTAEGLDGLPAWFLRVGAPIFSKVVAHLFNSSISQSHVASQWKTAIINPIPKISNPTIVSDFRPISVVPILSRTLEKIIVRSHLYPVLQDTSCRHQFDDQYAFRPTGSTTAAIISILQSITSLLAGENPHVILISLDFSKAFDTVRHYLSCKKWHPSKCLTTFITG